MVSCRWRHDSFLSTPYFLTATSSKQSRSTTVHVLSPACPNIRDANVYQKLKRFALVLVERLPWLGVVGSASGLEWTLRLLMIYYGNNQRVWFMDYIHPKLTPHACRIGSSVTFLTDQVAPANWLGEVNKQVEWRRMEWAYDANQTPLSGLDLGSDDSGWINPAYQTQWISLSRKVKIIVS
jgi:hypothetical protein